MRGKILGNRYRIISRIGEGGMAYVYLAKDEKLGRKVAIKVLHEHMETNADIRQRFQMEAQAVSALDHPNIVKIYDFSGDHSDRLWIVTEVIDGENLAQFVGRFPGNWLHPALATCIVREICKALNKAHHTGIVHRDIKPENIMLTKQGIVKLMDFGIAKDLGRSSMTVTGTFMGSPSYMSPEQIRGKGVDHRSDIYSLSVLYYEVVTGRLPFSGQTTHDVVMKIMEGHYTYPRFLVPTIPERLDKIIVKGMSKEKSERFSSIADMGKAIDQLLTSFGFVEAHVELERYFKDPAAYERRLAKLDQGGFNKQTLQRTRAQTKRDQASRFGLPANDRQSVATRGPTQYPHKKTTADSPPLRLKQTPKERTRTGIPLPEGPGHSVVRSRHSRIQLPDQPAKARSLPPRRLPQPKRSKSHTRHTLMERPVLPPPPSEYSVRDIAQPVAPQRQVQGRGKPRVRPKGIPHRKQIQRSPGRRSVQVVPDAPAVSGLFGFLLVGAVGLIAIWGFWELNQKLQENNNKPIVINDIDSNNGIESPRDRDSQRPKKQKNNTRRTVVRDKPGPTPVTEQDDNDNSSYTVSSRTPRPTEKPIRTVSTRPKATPRPVRNKRPDPTPSQQLAHLDQRTDVQGTPEPALPEPTPVNTETVETAATPAPTEAPQPEKNGPTRLFVKANPPAEIFLDGKYVGTTNATTTGSGWIKVSPGRHHWELRRRGYRSVKAFRTFPKGEDVNLGTIQLEAAEEKKFFITLEKPDGSAVQVELKHIDTKESHLLTLKRKGRKQLVGGRYQMRVKQGQDVVMERVFNLTGNMSIALPAVDESGGKEE